MSEGPCLAVSCHRPAPAPAPSYRGLNGELEKEGEGLAAPRGFIPTFQGSRDKCENQIFQFYTTAAVRKQYDSKMKQKLEQVS